MNVIITGRVFSGNQLLGYRLWYFDGSNLKAGFMNKVDIPYLFNQYSVLNCHLRENNSVYSAMGVPITNYPRYNVKGKMCGKCKYTDASIIAMTLRVNVEDVRIKVCGSLISGAISNVNSPEATTHAILYYEEIRHMSTDIINIARRTGFSKNEIARIKNYLFMEQHELIDGYKRFDESFEIAQSWQRLLSNNMKIEPHDLTLLNHEILEISLVQAGLTQNEAHIIATQSYNYEKECNEYYDKIK